ncbi:MAG: hypothetical protein WC683_02675 [bacterium]
MATTTAVGPERHVSWRYMGRLCARGHKLWLHVPSGRFAIGDDSGGIPPRCEDGTLWLDMREKTVLLLDTLSPDSTALRARVPLLQERYDNKPTCTFETAEGALELARRFPDSFEVRVKVGEKLYKLVEAE